jgi:hypothetical protein
VSLPQAGSTLYRHTQELDPSQSHRVETHEASTAHRAFPLPLFQLPPARSSGLPSSRRSQIRHEFNRLVFQLANLALTALNPMAAGLHPSAAIEYLHILYNTSCPLSPSARAAHARPRSSMRAPDAGRASASDAPSSTAASYPFAVVCADSHSSHTLPCRLVPFDRSPTPLNASAPSPMQLRLVEQLYGTVRSFAHRCRAWRPSRPPSNSASAASAPSSQAAECMDASGVSTLRHLSAYLHTYVSALPPRAIIRSISTHQLSEHNQPYPPSLKSASASCRRSDPARPPGAVPAPAPSSSAAALLQPAGSTLHAYAMPAQVVPLMAERIALPSDLQSIPILSLLPAELAVTYADPRSLLRPQLEVDLLNATQPLARPKVSGERSEYVKLIGRMLAVGMVRFTCEPKAINGVFAVAKDADADRLIIDAQPANRLFIDSPHVRLPNPSHLVQLSVPFGSQLFFAKSDLSNFYHQLQLPERWQPYFALPRLTDAECTQLGVPIGSAYPMCTTLPMGFSHAVVLAQAVHEFVLYSRGALCRSDNERIAKRCVQSVTRTVVCLRQHRREQSVPCV